MCFLARAFLLFIIPYSIFLYLFVVGGTSDGTSDDTSDGRVGGTSDDTLM